MVRTPAWQQNCQYDGFGNLTSKSVPVGSGEPVFPGADPATNRLTGASYDANGNVTAINGSALAYDGENRIVSSSTGSGTDTNVYDEQGHRVWQTLTSGTSLGYFYGPDGKLLSVFQLQLRNPQTTYVQYHQIYFGGLLLGTAKAYVGGEESTITDRLGSKRQTYAYGTDVPNQMSQTDSSSVDFATYLNDSGTGFEYADQRWYTTGYARFSSADAYVASAKGNDPGSPASWNRYSYVQGDPVNLYDPLGLFLSDPNCTDPYTCPSPNQLSVDLLHLWTTGYIALLNNLQQSAVSNPSQSCNIDLGIASNVLGTGSDHAWVEVEDTITIGNQSRTLFNTFIDGIPYLLTFLRPAVTQGKPYYGGKRIRNANVNCVSVVDVLGTAENFPKNVLYFGYYSNSNTLASYLLKVAGLIDWYNDSPPNTPGWGGEFFVKYRPVPNPWGIVGRRP